MSSRGASKNQKRPRRKDAKDFRLRPLLRLNWALKFLVTGFLALVATWGLQFLSFETTLETTLDLFRPIKEDSYWYGHREEVKDAFVASWDAYAKYAWGKFGRPKYSTIFISKAGSQMSPNGLGWIIVDSLDTLMIMNQTARLSDARKWLHRGLTYAQDQDVNTFEMTIRMLGGLLSAHYLSNMLPHVSSRRDYVYLTKAVDLADRLLSAYESESGIPYASVNIGTGQGLPSHANGGASSTAEATTLQLEMKYLAHLTGKKKYWQKAEQVMKVINDHQMQDGLVPIFIHPDTGQFMSREIRLGSRGDSYYEYLIKQYLQTSGQEPIYREMWEEALAGIQKHLVTSTKHSKLQFIAELPQGIGSSPDAWMEFNSQKEQQMQLARELTKTCWAMYAVTESGLSPEIVWFEVDEANFRPSSASSPRPLSRNDENSWKRDFIIKPLDAHNLQRPETVESLFLMYRVTNDPIYRKWGWKIFKAFQKHTIVSGSQGYTSLQDVTKVSPPQRDNMESFWLAETLKYLYLLFSPKEFLPLSEVVFNTEAHVLPRFNQTRFQTGWSRVKRS
ncbi:hypothetical protein CNMCM5623_002449 [Aspergillus felis]|uniref:alpha-1,2-Mannosidase n=1 Tax=Aspergillus felis TaxID=1287682 RepID=A0A8H6V0V0_9EURO|nr:hypothetical protein CNMCM5623_002449 [Aspergillus felis]